MDGERMQLTNKVYRDGQRIGSGVTKKKSTFRFPPPLPPAPPKRMPYHLLKRSLLPVQQIRWFSDTCISVRVYHERFRQFRNKKETGPTFAKTSGIVTRDSNQQLIGWVHSNYPRNNCGTHCGSSCIPSRFYYGILKCFDLHPLTVLFFISRDHQETHHLCS